MVELDLTPTAAPIGRKVGELAWPASTLLLAIRRDGHALQPGQDTQLEAGDRLTLLVPAAQADTLANHITQTRPPSTALAEADRTNAPT